MIALSGIMPPMKPRRKQRETRTHSVLWAVLLVLVGLGVAGFGCYQGVMGLVDEWTEDLPDITDTDAFQLPEASTIYANDGTTVLAEMYIEDREPVTIDQVSPYVLRGTVATEDERFYEHKGVDLQGIVRAVFVNLAGGQEGASTITQQYVRNTILSSEATDISLKRKVREIELAVELEKMYSKDEILMMYLNTINYGDNCYGIQAAARHYYSVDASDLTIAQAATLIGIPNSPTMYNPNTNPEASIERRNVVLSRMLTNNVITQEEYDAARAEDLNLNIEPEVGNNGIYKYEWFTTYVREQILANYDHDQVFEGGLQIVTTIDPTMQSYAEEAVANEYGQTVSDKQEFALTLVEPSTGFIKAMIGGKDYYADQYNIATSSQGTQTGSSFKAFTLADAIEKGISPSTTMNCNSPVTVAGSSISNYGGQSYGYLSIANMTAVSSNTGYIRLVTDSDSGVTPQSVKEMAERLGLNGDNLSAVPTITLGTSNANPTQMAGAYATFAAQGVHRDPTAILKITDGDGNVLVDNSAGVQGEQVLSESVAYAVTQVLEGVIYSSYGTAPAAALPSGQMVAGKTGTTEDWNDLWFVGYTPQLSCAVWTGTRDNSVTLETNSWCQDIWRNLISDCLEGQPTEDFKSAPAPSYNSSYKGGGSASQKSDDEEESASKQEENSQEENSGEETPSTEPTDPVNPTPDPGNGGGTGGGTTDPVDPGTTPTNPAAARTGGFSLSATPLGLDLSAIEPLRSALPAGLSLFKISL